MKVKCNMCNGFIDAKMAGHEKSIFPVRHLKEYKGRGGTSNMQDKFLITDGEFAEIGLEMSNIELFLAYNDCMYVRNEIIMNVHPHIAVISATKNIIISAANMAKYGELCAYISEGGCLCVSCGCAFDWLPPYELVLSHIKKCVKKTSVRYSYE